MVRTLQLALAAALAGQSVAQLPMIPGMKLKDMLGLVKSLPPALVTPQMASMFSKQVNGNYGKTNLASKSASKAEVPGFYTADIPGSKAIKIRHGPYTVPAMNKLNGLEEGGSLWNYADKEVDKPCSDCTVFGIQAGLEYADGSNANIDNDAWLHHMVLFNIGPNRRDATCETSPKSLPHIAVGTSPTKSERIFASGNERIPLYMNWDIATTKAKPAGYTLNPADKFVMLIDFMNEGMQDKTLYLTMTYNYVDGTPAGWDNVRPIWFDIDQCGFSDVKAPKKSTPFTIDAIPWKATFDGEILGWFGHLHDGGVSIDMTIDGKTECTSAATYGGKPEFVSKSAMGDHHGATEHISDMTICKGDAGKKTMMQKGQSWNLKANYDFSKHAGMMHEDGQAADIMGISFMYVRVPR